MGKKILLHWTRLLVLVMTIGLSGMISQESWGQATVKTDREDYQPGDYVKITGSGWQPGETVSFHFEEDPKPTTCVNPHDLVAIADENGNIYNDQFLIRENHLGVTFTLTAAGQSSGLVATTVFTDALLFSATISPVSICANTVQTYSLVVTNNTTNTGGTTGNNARLGSIRIFIPTGFSSVSSISSSLPFRFSASLVSGNIEIVRTGGASNSLAPGESITITFQATSPASAGAYEFTTEAWVSNDFSPVKYPAIGSEQNPGIQPGVTVNPSTLITTSPNNSIVTYGSNPTFSVSATGSGTLTYAWEEFNGSWNPVANGVIYSGANTNTLTLTKPGTALSGRQYRVKVTGGCGTVTSSPATLTVNPLAASVTPDDNTKEYGSADPTLTGTLSGFLAGDNVTAVYSRASGETVLGGPYEISAVLSPSEVLSNYDITYNTGEFTIIPREATITADNRIKTYGETVVFAGTEFTTSGLLNSDAVSSVTLTSAGAAATATVSGSPYAIVASDAVGSGLDNYTIRYEDGELTITPRPITVTADDKIIFCGQAEPTLTYQITSGTLVNGDAFSGTLVRQTGNGAGTYVISKGSLTLVDNYELTVVNGIFTINAISVNAQGSFVNIQINSSGVLSATVSPAEAGIPVTFTFYRDGILTPYETKTGTTNTNGVATVDWTAPNAIEVFRVEVMAGSDACDAKEEAYVTVFDPSASFVTGGGWINSPAGSMRANPTAVGKANFGFVSKYKKGKNNTFTNEVDGNTEFQFQAGDLNFKSTMHESGSLVISGSRATYRGTGTVNGASGFRFVVVAIDGQWNGQSNPDRFRIKITTTNGTVIYDNGLGADENGNDATILGNNGTGGGSIVIHEVKAPAKGNKRVSTELMTVAWNTPVETIKKQVDQLSLTWFESRKLPMTLDASNYDPLTPGFYELKVDLMDNEFFALDEPISIQVLVQDKPKALDILVDNSKLTKELRVGDVLGILRTIDPVDNIHTYGIGDHPDLTLDGDKLIWKGTTVPAQLKLTVFSTDRAGQTISREISLSREMKPGEFFLYPNPAQRETNVMVDLDQEASVAIRIYDAVGRMVVENEAYREGSFTQTFNLDGLAAGFYTVQVKVGDMVMTKRLIKK